MDEKAKKFKINFNDGKSSFIDENTLKYIINLQNALKNQILIPKFYDLTKSLNNYKVQCPDGFSWEFNARSKMKGFNFKNIPMTHKKRPFGDTKIYTFSKLPKIAYNNLMGLLKLKKEIG